MCMKVYQEPYLLALTNPLLAAMSFQSAETGCQYIVCCHPDQYWLFPISVVPLSQLVPIEPWGGLY